MCRLLISLSLLFYLDCLLFQKYFMQFNKQLSNSHLFYDSCVSLVYLIDPFGKLMSMITYIEYNWIWFSFLKMYTGHYIHDGLIEIFMHHFISFSRIIFGYNIDWGLSFCDDDFTVQPFVELEKPDSSCMCMLENIYM